MIYEENV